MRRPHAGRAPRGVGRPWWWSGEVGERALLLALAATPGPLPCATADRLAQGYEPVELLRPEAPDPALVAERLRAVGGAFLTPADPDWPLAGSPPDPPCAWLFVAGRPLPPPAASVAVVGGRKASPLRVSVAEALAGALAAAGQAVVSGGAVGVDAAAHRGALAAGGSTVAVLGCGLDVAYPRVNAGLLARIRLHGSLVGEHPPGSAPRPQNFVPRNRLIAALATAVVVVEAGRRSGSLATARAAGARGAGRVLAIPGAPWDPGAAGCNDLIRDGAVLVRDAADVLDELRAHTPMAAGDPAGPPGEPVAVQRADAMRGDPAPGSSGSCMGGEGLGMDGRRVLEALADGLPVTPGRLGARTGLGPGALARAVLEVELAGFARRCAAGIQAVAPPPAGPFGQVGRRSVKAEKKI